MRVRYAVSRRRAVPSVQAKRQCIRDSKVKPPPPRPLATGKFTEGQLVAYGLKWLQAILELGTTEADLAVWDKKPNGQIRVGKDKATYAKLFTGQIDWKSLMPQTVGMLSMTMQHLTLLQLLTLRGQVGVSSWKTQLNLQPHLQSFVNKIDTSIAESLVIYMLSQPLVVDFPVVSRAYSIGSLFPPPPPGDEDDNDDSENVQQQQRPTALDFRDHPRRNPGAWGPARPDTLSKHNAFGQAARGANGFRETAAVHFTAPPLSATDIDKGPWNDEGAEVDRFSNEEDGGTKSRCHQEGVVHHAASTWGNGVVSEPRHSSSPPVAPVVPPLDINGGRRSEAIGGRQKEGEAVGMPKAAHQQEKDEEKQRQEQQRQEEEKRILEEKLRQERLARGAFSPPERRVLGRRILFILGFLNNFLPEDGTPIAEGATRIFELSEARLSGAKAKDATEAAPRASAMGRRKCNLEAATTTGGTTDLAKEQSSAFVAPKPKPHWRAMYSPIGSKRREALAARQGPGGNITVNPRHGGDAVTGEYGMAGRQKQHAGAWQVAAQERRHENDDFHDDVHDEGDDSAATTTTTSSTCGDRDDDSSVSSNDIATEIDDDGDDDDDDDGDLRNATLGDAPSTSSVGGVGAGGTRRRRGRRKENADVAGNRFDDLSRKGGGDKKKKQKKRKEIAKTTFCWWFVSAKISKNDTDARGIFFQYPQLVATVNKPLGRKLLCLNATMPPMVLQGPSAPMAWDMYELDDEGDLKALEPRVWGEVLVELNTLLAKRRPGAPPR